MAAAGLPRVPTNQNALQGTPMFARKDGHAGDVLAFVMAGGEGRRLHPLTAGRCKPAVPFNGRHRIVDFVLSNLVNSGIGRVYLLVQYKSQSLIEHVRQTWTTARALPQHFVTVVPPQMRHGPQWFEGTADAVWQNLQLLDEHQPGLVAVFGADHIYRMDVGQMIDFHRQHEADVTVATLPVPLSDCSGFGIVGVDGQHRVRQFLEKPAMVPSMAGRPGMALASMGNYIFSTDVLRRELQKARDRGESDFGRDILPRLLKSHRVMAYDFHTNVIPGIGAQEEHGYWRDVGTIDAYFAAHFDTLGPTPRFGMSNRQWPIHACPDDADAAQIESGAIHHSSVGAGCIVEAATLDHAMLRRSVHVQAQAQLAHCIVMDRSVVGTGARLKRVIVDQDNHIPPYEVIGHDLAKDRQRFEVSDGGIVVVPKGHFPPRAERRVAVHDGAEPRVG
jgi:glucose-1-phosphate adenylyltransferase